MFGLHPATPAQAGSYRVEVRNAAGAVSSAPATLAVQPPPAKPIVVATFQADPTLRGTPTVILPLPDGRVVVAVTNPGDGTIDPLAAEVIRLLPNGQIDPAFRRAGVAAAEFAWQPTIYRPEVRQLILQPGGQILVTGYFGSYDGAVVPGMVRLRTDGTVDPSFRAAITPPGPPRTVRDFVAYAPIAAPQPDGRIVYLTPEGEVRRLLANGDDDPSFQAPGIFYGARTLAVSPTGRIFIGAGSVLDGRSGSVSALLDDGRVDPNFPRYACAPVDQLYATSEDGVIVGTGWDSGPIRPGDTGTRFPVKTFRLRANGTLDATLPARDIALAAPPAPDGSLLLTGGRMVKPDGVTEWRPNFGAGYDYHVRVQQFAPDGRLWLGGDFSVYNGTRTQGVALLNLDAAEQLTPPRILEAWADPTTFWPGDPVTFRVVAVAPGPVTFSLFRNPGNLVASSNAPELIRPGPVGTYSVQVSNSAGTATSANISPTRATGDARVVRQAYRVSLTPGRYNEAFWVELSSGFQPVRAEWLRNGVRVAGPPGGLVDPSQAGTYVATYTDVFGNMVSTDPIVVIMEDISRFTNLSTRAPVGSGEEAAILGFVVPTGSWREFVLRGIGPALARFGVEAPLSAARLEVFRADGGLLARTNADGTFEDGPIGAFPLSSGGGDAALRISLGPGSYTARLSGIGTATGTGLIELYETGNLASRISNLSSRVLVAPTPAGSAIAGFAIRGAVPKYVLIRAAGPALAAFRVDNVLPNPQLEVRDESGRRLFENDDWGTQDATGIAAAAASVGAFPFVPGSRDAALKLTLPPANYTAVISGSDDRGGVVLVEVYELP